MTWRRTTLATFLVGVALTGCEAAEPPLELESVSPGIGSQGLPTPIVIFGDFYAPVSADLFTGEQNLDEDFLGWIGDALLGDVRLRSDESLAAEVPRGLAPGLYPIEVEDPLGRRAILEDAFRVLPPDDQGPSVEILEPVEGTHVLAGSIFEVRYIARERQPGRVTAVDYRAQNGSALDDRLDLPEPAAVVERSFLVEARFDARQDDERVMAVEVTAWDDAPNPNPGTARVEVLIDNCEQRRDCDDGRFCNGRERCQGGWCEADDEVLCTDPFDCTLDSCDEERDTCVHEPHHELCDDGRACTGEELCTSEAGCVAGAPLCDDGVECTSDYCDEATLLCWTVPSDEACQDGEFCNGIEVCDEALGCLPGVSPCLDGLECTIDECNEGSRSCAHLPDHLSCNDTDPCTVERCDLWEGCVSEPGTDGPVGSPSCEDGVDGDCDGRPDGDEPECSPPPCATLDLVAKGAGAADVVVDLCATGLDPDLIRCESDRNEVVLAEADFEAGLGSATVAGGAAISGGAQSPYRPGAAGLSLCGDGAVMELSADTRGRRGLALRFAAANETLSAGEYFEVQLSTDHGALWHPLVVLGDGIVAQQRRRTLLLPTEAENLPDLRVRARVLGGAGCAALDEVALVELPPAAATRTLVFEDFEVGFGSLAVHDPAGGDVSRRLGASGMMAQVAGGDGAWVEAVLRTPVAGGHERLAASLLLSSGLFGPHGYGRVQYSLDRGASWVVVLGGGLGERLSELDLGVVLPADAANADEVHLRVMAPPSSVAAIGDGLQVDDLSIRAETPAFVDEISAFVDMADGTYRATLTSSLSGPTRMRCVYGTGGFALWTPTAVVGL